MLNIHGISEVGSTSIIRLLAVSKFKYMFMYLCHLLGSKQEPFLFNVDDNQNSDLMDNIHEECLQSFESHPDCCCQYQK
jgi:hypothetical protein